MSTTDTEEQQTDEEQNDTGRQSSAQPGAEPSETMENPPAGEPDLADLSNRHHAGEKMEPILEGYWVRIGEHKDVDEKFWGHFAAVVRSTHKLCQCDWSDRDHYHQDPKAALIVRTRDEYNAQISLPLDAVAEKAQDRATLHPYA